MRWMMNCSGSSASVQPIFYEYAISQKNGCLVCSIYFQNLLKKNGIDFENFAFTPKEEILIEYGQAIAENPKHVPEETVCKAEGKLLRRKRSWSSRRWA